MQSDLLESPATSCDLDPRPYVDLDQSRSICTCFDTSRRMEYDVVRIVPPVLFFQRLFTKNVLVNVCYFKLHDFWALDK